jgi:IS4 transposase
LTSHSDLSSRTIAAIYKDRWQVELFFKAIKQNLKIKAFAGTSKNAILTQIWIAMCTYLLLAYAKFVSKTAWPIQRVMRVLQLSLFERRSLFEILTLSPPPDRKGEPQPRFAL